MKISDDLKIYAAYARLTEAHINLAKEIKFAERQYHFGVIYKMRKWIYNIFDIFESEMLNKGKDYYSLLVEVLRDKVSKEFRNIINKPENKSLEKTIK